MRKYYVWYYRDFGNTFRLYYTRTPEEEELLPEGAYRIKRKVALAMARNEAWMQKVDPAFSGYADDTIAPIGVSEDELLRYYTCRGRIWEEK